jgi:hypothetical protein
MTPSELRDSKTPPAGPDGPLTALWHLAKGDWHKAHKVVQDDDGAEAAWVHAHLHRVEGDESNAGYWYARAGKPHAQNSHAEEWNEIAGVLLAGHGSV